MNLLPSRQILVLTGLLLSSALAVGCSDSEGDRTEGSPGSSAGSGAGAGSSGASAGGSAGQNLGGSSVGGSSSAGASGASCNGVYKEWKNECGSCQGTPCSPSQTCESDFHMGGKFHTSCICSPSGVMECFKCQGVSCIPAGQGGTSSGGSGQGGSTPCTTPCVGVNNLGQSVTAACGESVCGSNSFLYVCTGDGFAGPGAACGGDAGGSSGSGGSGAGGSGGSGQGGSGATGGSGGSGQGGSGGSGQGGTGGSDPAGGSGGSGAGGSGATGGSGGSGQGGSGGSGQGGSAGSGATGGSGGSGQGGSGGSGAAGSGQGGSGPTGNPALKKLGAACDSDADCDGGTCLLASSGALSGGGPAGGLCVVSCTAWLQNPQGSDPCIEFPDANLPANAHCVDEGGAGYCLRSCVQGEPPGAQLDPDKCFGRPEVACFSETDASGVATRSYCKPQCASDAECGGGLKCDQGSGVCRGSVPAAKKTGELCNTAVAGQCEGVCAGLYDPNDPQTPVSKKNSGICVDPCVFGAPLSCGGESVGFCGLNLFTPVDGETGQQGALGGGDLGGCIEVTTAKNDAKCLWQEGWFATSLDGLPSLCLPALPCPNGQGDCAGTGLSCRKVDAVCGRSFCTDHDITGLPLNDPSVNCDPGQGG